MEILDYLPIRQTPDAEIAFQRMLERANKLKLILGDKYLLAKENAIQRADANPKTLINVGGNTVWLSTELHNKESHE